MVFTDALRTRVSSFGLLGMPILLLLVARPDISLQEEIFGFGICCTVYAVFLVFWIWVMVWVYRDAESRQMSGVLWVVIVFLLGIIGLIIYLVVRDPKYTAPPTYYQQPGYYPQQYQDPYGQQPYQQPYQDPNQQQPYQQPYDQGGEQQQQYDPETGQYK